MMTINGTLNANGNENNPIRFTRYGNSDTWGVLFFYETDSKCLLNYCIIEYTYAITSWDYIYALGAVSLFKSKLDMNHVTINVDNYFYPVHFHTKSELSVKSSILHNTKGKILCFYSLSEHSAYFYNSYLSFGKESDNYGYEAGASNIKYYNCIKNSDGPGFQDADGGNYALSSYSQCKGKGEYGTDMGAVVSGASKSNYSDNNSKSYSGSSTISNKQEVYGTWTKSKSPYTIQGEAIVPEGKTLTIEPGVTVKFKTGTNKRFRQRYAQS
ncbi:MAG: hypothetical protein BWY70_00025 [Bacteroidetes bacterium ADurb.Bin408]|nr:MAG: hypothetical protein BWY70_00025 [Bacteroidetes bacterium ADurb.Bin408]